MPPFLTHQQVIEESLDSLLPRLWSEQRDRANLGSCGPDMFYLTGLLPQVFRPKRRHKYAKISDIIHWEGSLDMFCAMLDFIKSGAGNSSNPQQREDRMLAFALGFMSHVVVDSLFHPYVYLTTGDHWFYHTKKALTRHKFLENEMGTYLLRRRRNTDPYDPEGLRFCDHINCFEERVEKGIKTRGLDEDVFNAMSQGLKTYERIFARRGISHHNYFGQYPNDSMHPIRLAYEDFNHYIQLLFKYADTLKAVLSRVKIPELEAMIPLEGISDEKSNLFRPLGRKWYDSRSEMVPKISAREIYNLAVMATKQIVYVAMSFLYSSDISSREHFTNNYPDVVFLDVNYNLDTGLPSRFNDGFEKEEAKKKVMAASRKGEEKLKALVREIFRPYLKIIRENYRIVGNYKDRIHIPIEL